MDNRWESGPASDSDALDQIVYLSNRIGLEETLVQPGGGNTSIKVTDADSGAGRLLVKGSGTDLRTIGRPGFTSLSLERLAGLTTISDLSDEGMMGFLQDCMLDRSQPLPSVETPLHSLLPHRVIVHTHDVATMSLTNVAEETGRRLVGELFDDRIHYVPYARPGEPLARLVAQQLPEISGDAEGLVLAHHGLVVWGTDVEQCYRRLLAVVNRIEEHFAAVADGEVLGGHDAPSLAEARRTELAQLLMPVIRGELGAEERVILHFDDQESVRGPIGRERFGALSQRGMSTPEHVLRAGRLPLWLPLDFDAAEDQLINDARAGIARCRESYLEYHHRHAEGQAPLVDWAKVVLIPGLGMVTAFKDKKSARTANACYRAVIASITNAESLGGFEFLPDEAVFEFEHWPLERRKVEEAIKKERQQLLVPRHVVLVVGGASGIGRAAAERFVAEGASVVVADLDGAAAAEVAGQLGGPGRCLGIATDVTELEAVRNAVSTAVLSFGGLDGLFYAAGAPPRFASIADIEPQDLERQFQVHCVGAVMTMREVARVMIRQQLGGSITASVSKAALVPGREAVAYGASKAALLQAMRVAAVELGVHGIRVNAINADQIDTPLFRRFVAQRAASRGVTVEEQLATYRQRNLMGESLIPASAVADLAVLLASSRFRYTTGDIITVDGGLPEAFPR